MKIFKYNLFSLVELSLAIGILAIGATSVITLMPIGIKQKKEAIGENYSALFTNDAQSYFSSLAQSSFDSLTSLPTYSAVFSDTARITAAEKTKGLGNDLYDTNVPGVYIISKHSGSIQDYAGEVVVWQSDPYSQDTLLTKKTVTTTTKTITGGVVSNTTPVNVSMKCLASEWTNGSKSFDVYFELIITEPGKEPYTYYPFGKNVAATSGSAEWNLPNVPAGTTIVAKAIDAENPNHESTITKRLSTDLTHVKTLKNGDLVPTDVPFYKSQSSAGAIVRPYVSSDGKTMNLGKDQVIYLFDLNTSGAYDFQDLVVMANLPPTETHDVQTSVAGIGISPANDTFSLTGMYNGQSIELTSDILKKGPFPAGLTEESFIDPNGTEGVLFSVNSMNMKLKGNNEITVGLPQNESR